MRKILVGCVYHHFKGNDYEVLYTAKHSETMEDMVVYKNLSDDSLWVRPYNIFNSLVDTNKYPNVKQKFRFELKNKGGK